LPVGATTSRIGAAIAVVIVSAVVIGSAVAIGSAVRIAAAALSEPATTESAMSPDVLSLTEFELPEPQAGRKSTMANGAMVRILKKLISIR
jgi:hypothetical protein